MHNDNGSGNQFVESAYAFCGLIEQIDCHQPKQWLQDLGTILLRLEAAIAHMTPVTPVPPNVWLSDLEKRYELFTRLKEYLGNLDEYWSEADLHAGDGYMTGSLSDDLADIYFELKRGLMLHQQGGASEQTATLLWTSSYQYHWRQHLTDARKQLVDFGPKALVSGTTSQANIHRAPKKPV